jgi:hypothetical protein
MSQTANVRSVESIKDFRVALTNFAEDARNALSSVEMEIRKTRDWLQRDQLMYWQTQIKRRNEQVSMARVELHRRKLSQANSDAISDTEQKENLKIAQHRLEEAEQKLQLVKKWVPLLDHAIAEYHSAAQPLGDRLTGALVNSLTLLDRMVASLDAYLILAPPSTPPVPEATTSAPAAASTPASTPEQAQATSAAEEPEREEEESAPAAVESESEAGRSSVT